MTVHGPRLAVVFLLVSCGVAVNEAPESLDEANRVLMAGSPPLDVDMAPYLDPVVPEYRIGPGDRLSVDVAGQPALAREGLLVRPDGMITLYVIEDVYVAGRTPKEAARHIEGLLKRLVPDPHVVVSLTEARSQRFMVLGAVQRPGVFPLEGPMSMLEALALAGGLMVDPTGRASGDIDRASLMRSGTIVPVRFSRLLGGDAKQNVWIRPGDLVFVPPYVSGEVYVLGEVRSPAVVDHKGMLTLMQALTKAGWVTENGKETAVRVIRGALVDPKVYVVDAEDIGAGKRRDVLLAPGDIVFVTTTEVADWNAVVNAIAPTLQMAVSARYLVEGVTTIFTPSN
ncbi:MAG: hypothetical protein AMXMBFR64_26140 [Myxococcales bacterium]